MNILEYHNCHKPSCSVSCVGFKNGSCQLSFCLLMPRSKVKGCSFRIYGSNEYVMIMIMSVTILGRYSMNRGSRPSFVESRYLKAGFNKTFK